MPPHELTHCLIFISRLAQLPIFSVLVDNTTSELPLTPPPSSGPIPKSTSYVLLTPFPFYHHHHLEVISHLEN